MIVFCLVIIILCYVDDSTGNSGAFRRGRDFGRIDDVVELHRRRIVLLPAAYIRHPSLACVSPRRGRNWMARFIIYIAVSSSCRRPQQEYLARLFPVSVTPAKCPYFWPDRRLGGEAEPGQIRR